MKKKILIFCTLLSTFVCVSGTFGQIPPTLAGQMEKVINEQFPDWKSVREGQIFKTDNFDQHRIEARLENGGSKLSIQLSLRKTPAEMDESFRWAFLRQIIPVNYPVKNLGDKAHLFETGNWVEIVMAKENIYASLNYYFPIPKNKKVSIYSTAPQSEKNKIIKYAHFVANAIDGKKTATNCYNDFYKPEFPASAKPEENLFAAIARADGETLQTLITQGIDLNQVFKNGETPLYSAIKQGCFDTVKTLVEAKADVNGKTDRGETALMLAANLNNLDLLKYLVGAGANVKIKDKQGRNAAFYPFGYRRFFISKIEDVPLKNPTYEERQKEVFYFLRESGLNLNEKDSSDDTLLTALIKDGCGGENCKFLINLFVDSGLNINDTNNDGRSALIEYILRSSDAERSEILQLLIKRGADVNLRDKRNNKTALEHLLRNREIYANDKHKLYFIEQAVNILKSAGAKE